MFYYGDPCQPCSFFCNIFIFLIKAWSWLCSTIWCPAHPCRTVRCVPALPPVCPILPFSPPPRAFCCHCYSGSAKANWLTCRVKIIQHLYFFGIVVVFLNHMCYFFLEKNILLTHLLTCSGVSYSYHWRLMETEAKARVVASVWRAEFIHCLAALAILPWSIWKNRMNSTFSSKSTAARNCINSVPQTDMPTIVYASLSILLLCSSC